MQIFSTQEFDKSEHLLHGFDFKRRLAHFCKLPERVRTLGGMVRAADFKPVMGVPLDELLAEQADTIFQPPHFIFMTDFCGSNLLVQALLELGGITCWNEVNAFADLSIQKRLIDRERNAACSASTTLSDWQKVLRLALQLMSESSRITDTVIVKEWPPANYIISDIMLASTEIRAVFLYGDIEDYLNSVFRHWWRRDFTRRRVLRVLIETDRWPSIDAEKHWLTDAEIAAAHWFVQQQAFLNVDPRVVARVRSVNNGSLYERPERTILAVARHLGLTADLAGAKRAFAQVANHHSKSGKPYSMAIHRLEVARVARTHAFDIREGLAQLRSWTREFPLPPHLPHALDLDNG